MFVYSGFGAYRDGGNYLMTDDANLADIDRRDMIDYANEWVEMHMMSLTLDTGSDAPSCGSIHLDP